MAKAIKSHTDKWEKFSAERYQASLSAAAVPQDMIEALTLLITEAPEIRTAQDISEFTYVYLKIKDRSLAARYSLKQGLYQLGYHPMAFVEYLGKLFFELEYTVRLDHTLKGKCVDHESPLIISKDDNIELIHCVVKKDQAELTSLSSVLSLKALLDDLTTPIAARLITNAHLTQQAVAYADCIGIPIIGWNYPAHADLRMLIHTQGLYPITCLTGLSKTQKIILIQKNFLLCKELLDRRDLLKKIQVPGQYRQGILDECAILSKPQDY